MNLVCYYYTTQLYLKTFLNFLNIYIITKIFLKVKFLFMVPAGGVEPPTARVWTECSSQLSYTGICKYKLDHTHPTVLSHTPKPCPSVVLLVTLENSAISSVTWGATILAFRRQCHIIIGWCVPFTTPISVTHCALRVTTLFAVSYLLPLVAPIM